ncbi:MAG: NAD(P)-binding domain-containing protein [Lysinibacillus sp.]
MELKIINQPASCCDPSTGCCEPALPVAIIGAGPVGLAAAAHLKARNQECFILEAGEVAANVLSWQHVTLFSPWQYNIDAAAKELLEQKGWKAPEGDVIPTGRQLVEQYLKPLAELLGEHVHTNHKVIAIARKEADRMKSPNRADQPFIIYAQTCCGVKTFEARAVIDATGTWGNPNPAQANGVWLPDEKMLADKIDYMIPDFSADEALYANKRIAVIGGGHSAINSLLGLAGVKEKHPATSITWILRKKRVEDAFGGGSNDELAARGELGLRIAELVEKGVVEVETPFYIMSMSEQGGIVLTGKERILPAFDRLIVNTGSRPDFDIHRELRFEAEAITEAVPALAPLIDPNEHSCGSVAAHGEQELRQPEKNFYIVGSKSYGRAPTFLMATGYEQVRSVAAYLAGDLESARNVELSLPETGVCHSGAGGCC